MPPTPAAAVAAAVAAGGTAELRACLSALVVAPRVYAGLSELFSLDRDGDPADSVGAVVLPEVAALRMDQPDGARHKDNLVHSLRVCARTPAREELRWAALFHDTGKPSTRRVVAGKVEFHNHEVVSRRLARRRLRALGYPAEFVRTVGELIVVAGKISSYEADLWTDSSVRRIVTDAGPDLVAEACWLARADCTSRYADRRRAAARRVDAFVAHVAAVAAADAAAARRPLIDGRRVMEIAQIPPGPVVAVLLREVLAAEDAGRIASAADAEALVAARAVELAS